MDPVSNLPDEILCHILSFLTTKEAARTSILAKRWRYLLASVPSLTISDTEFLHSEEDKRYRPDIIQSFKDFVDRVLALQGTNFPLKKFSFDCDSVDDKDLLDGWISIVLARGVSDLYLQISLSPIEGDYTDCDPKDYDLSPKCFECSTLVKLELDMGIDIRLIASIYLPLLKTLVLQSLHVCPNKFQTLLHSLPSLEELSLSVDWEDYAVTVSSACVKTLKIHLTERLNTLSFDTPSLLHFDYSGEVALDYPVVNMEKVVDAKIFLRSEYRRDKYSKAWKLFHGIRKNVANLDLFPDVRSFWWSKSDTLDMLSLWSESVPVFNNLIKSLAVKSNMERGILALLRKCPHLETLVFEGLVHHECGDVCDCILREDKGFSLTRCPVKVIKIHRFQGKPNDVEMIAHLWEYFPSLEEVVVYLETKPFQLEPAKFFNFKRRFSNSTASYPVPMSNSS